MKHNFQLGQIVYHRNVLYQQFLVVLYDYRENELELEGDYSGGTNNVCQKQWMPIEGVSYIYNHKYKQECREYAVAVEALAVPITDRNQDTMTKTMFDLLDMVFVLTNDVSLNPEF